MRPEALSAVQVFDCDRSRLLATGGYQSESESGGHSFTCREGNGALLAYYFGKGNRQVVVRTGRNEGVTAHLGTRWAHGHREWTLDW